MKKDIYFEENYGKLYEEIEKGKANIFRYEDENGVISNQFIIREIPIRVDEKTYYDITTPYGYGGPIIEKCINGKEKELVKRYYKKFNEYCSENKIVSEFVRFHPILNNAKDFKEVYNAKCIRKTLGTNLKDFEDPVASEFSKSCRKTIRQAIKKGIEFKMIENVTDFSESEKIYYDNMDRKNAEEYYFFKDKYFKMMNKYFHDKLIQAQALYEGKVIAEGLYFIYNKTIHAHLSGTNRDYLYLSPAYILKYGTAIWGKQHGYELIHYGGGTSNKEDDTLYLFKKKFSQNTEFDFCIGTKIWDKEVYKKLCRKRNILNDDVDYFPAYRK